MFPSFQLPMLRRRTRSLSSPCTGDKAKPPKTPVGSPKEKKNRRSHLFRRGNSDLGTSPSVTSLRPGSVAFTSDQLAPGDKIHSVNGIKTCRMRAADVNSLLDNVDGNAMLEVSWALPKYNSQNALNVVTKIADVTIERSDGSLGITLRGGAVKGHPGLSRPLIITHVRPNGPAARTGLIRVGDRILKVDNHSLINKTLQEAQHLLRDTSSKSLHGVALTTLTIEYEVGDMESVKCASGGPLLVEIDRPAEEDFGVIINNCCDFDSMEDAIMKAGYFVRHIIPASLADRCGALNIGDQILAIDDINLEDFPGNTQDAEMLLRKAKKMQILPYHALQRYSRNYGYNKCLDYFSSTPSISGYSTITSRHSRRRKLSSRQSIFHKSIDVDFGSNCYGFTNIGICHPENLTVILVNEKGINYGITASVSEHSDTKQIVISRIIQDSPAYRCGCLQVGDRIISINHKDNLTLQEISSILDSNDQNQITLEVEFDVADTIVPSSGVFTVKLAKRGPDLGITITASKVAPDDPFLISEIRRGSIAHRTGTLHAGDRIIAIDNRNLNQHSVETAFEILQNSPNDIVTLKIEKTETENGNLFLDSVVYTVELHRYGGPLGITISGSEDCTTPIVLSRITEGGLADKTGALHVGDRILAINKESLEHRRLSDAIRLLKNSGDRVQLKIARNMKSIETKTNLRNDSIRESQEETILNKNIEDRGDYSSPDGVMSIDSAIHSWDSHNMENDGLPDESESILSEISIPYQEKERKHDSQLQFYSDTDEIFCPSPLPLPNYTFSNKYDNRNYQPINYCNYTEDSLSGYDIFHVTLYKDSVYDDYGFSVSDGLYEKGVYVNKIRKDGPADIVGLLKPYDRILQVNETRTQDFDCCLTVPLIASAGDRIELVLARNPYINYYDKEQDGTLKRSLPNHNVITKML